MLSCAYLSFVRFSPSGPISDFSGVFATTAYMYQYNSYPGAESQIAAEIVSRDKMRGTLTNCVTGSLHDWMLNCDYFLFQNKDLWFEEIPGEKKEEEEDIDKK